MRSASACLLSSRSTRRARQRLPARRHYGGEGIAPIGADRHEPVMRAERTIGRGISTGRVLAALDGARCLEQQAAHYGDGAIRGAEVLLRAIGDRTHAFLQGDVLRVDAFDAGEARRLLRGAIDEIVIREIGLEAEGPGNVVVLAATIERLGLLDITGIERAIGIVAVGPVIDERRLVIDRDPDMAIDARNAAVRR